MNGKFFQRIVGEREEEFFHFPSEGESIKKLWKKSNYPLRLLGVGEEELYISEEERESHMHVIGTTREGKSKFLEYMIRGDIDRGNGLCFFDPSDRGDTLYKILAYCEQVGHKKVLLIDPHHKYTRNRICPINPFGEYREASVAKTMDTLRILYGQSEWASTPIIRKYLRAVLNLLWNAGLALADSEVFAKPNNVFERVDILSKTDEDDRQRQVIEAALGTPTLKRDHALFVEYQSTVRRLEEIFHPLISLMFGAKQGIDFTKLIAEGWVVLVNLYEWYGIEQMQTRLIGTAIINEIIESIDRLRTNGWEGRYYLYIDEAGLYTTESIAKMLAHKSKSGLSLILAHQYYDQFENLKVLKAIQNLCKIKVAFYIPDSDDRLKVVRAMYGGQLDDRDVSYSLSNLRKQHAVVKLPKQPPVIIRIPDTKDLPSVSDEYLNFIYSNPVYLTSEQITQETRNRAIHYETKHDLRENHIPPRKTPKANRRADSKTGVPEPKDTHQGWDRETEQFKQRNRTPKTDGE